MEGSGGLDGDLFGDLMSPSSSSGGAKNPTTGGPAQVPKAGRATAVPDVFSANGPAAAASEAPAPAPGITKEELDAVVRSAVHQALDASFSHLVKSLRIVLEDLVSFGAGVGQGSSSSLWLVWAFTGWSCTHMASA